MRKSKKVCDGTDLATILGQSGALSTMDDKQFGELAKTSSFLCRIQLFGANSNLVKSAVFPMAHWGYVSDKESPVDLGDKFDFYPLAVRGCAIRLTGEKVMAVYDMADPEFEKIRVESDIQDSGCAFGPEFLIYIPSIDKFSTYHMNSKTARRESPKLKAMLGKACSLKSKLIKTPKYTWHGPEVMPCSSPLNLPSANDITENVTKFLNPPKNEVTKADTASRDR